MVLYINRYGKKLYLLPDLYAKWISHQALLRDRGIEVEMTDAWRGQADQQAALAAGTSSAQWGRSPHGYGAAYDLAPIVNGTLTWDVPEQLWSSIGKAGADVGLQWGHDWDMDGVIGTLDPDEARMIKDRPHFQIPGWGNLNLALVADPTAPATA